MTIDDRYRNLCAAPSDINEHLPLLRELASQCDHVTEFGTRGAVSTTALLAGKPKTMITWDINPLAIVNQSILDLVAVMWNSGTTFQPRVGDTLAIAPIEQTDFLFVDSLHTTKQLVAELTRHADPVTNNVRRYLAFHDTETFGMRGENGSEPGLLAAIRWFQRCHAFPIWELVYNLPNNNGLIVLRNLRWKR